MKKLSTVLATVTALALLMTACGAAPSADKESAQGNTEKKLVVYTSESEIRLNQIVPQFQEETGIEVELITGGLAS